MKKPRKKSSLLILNWITQHFVKNIIISHIDNKDRISHLAGKVYVEADM